MSIYLGEDFVFKRLYDREDVLHFDLSWDDKTQILWTVEFMMIVTHLKYAINEDIYYSLVCVKQAEKRNTNQLHKYKTLEFSW